MAKYPFNRIQERFFTQPQKEAVPRLVVIDGCNVARSSCGTNRENVNCAGLMAIIRFFLVRDIDVVAFLPVIYNNNYNFNATYAQVLPKLHELDVVTFTPARTARGERRAFINYDDLYVLEFADRYGGSVLSGDRFEDIANHRAYKQFRKIIRERRIGVKFRPLQDDFVHYGRDRFFKCVPELWIYDSDDGRPLLERVHRRLFCLPTDSDYAKVVCRRASWSFRRRNEIVEAIDALFDEIATKSCTVPKVIAEPVGQVDKNLVTDQSSPLLPSEGASASICSDSSERTSWAKQYRIPSNASVEEIARRWLSPPLDDEQCEPHDDLQTALSPGGSEELTRNSAEKSDENLAPLSPDGLHAPASGDHSRQMLLRGSASSQQREDGSQERRITDALGSIFDRELVQNVLHENASTDMHIIADICAQIPLIRQRR